jgi:hypothetical protein
VVKMGCAVRAVVAVELEGGGLKEEEEEEEEGEEDIPPSPLLLLPPGGESSSPLPPILIGVWDPWLRSPATLLCTMREREELEAEWGGEMGPLPRE